GYDTIGALLQGQVPGRVMVGILLVKSLIWSVSLGSGTSGGVLAPLLLMGGALGGVEALILPDAGLGFWPLVSMGAILGGTMRSPFTGVIFALELTHDVNVLLPLLVSVTLAHGFTVLALRRSILTEKISRRGYHLSREYALDPLEILFVRDVMRTAIVVLPASATLEQARELIRPTHKGHGQHLFPVVEDETHVIGVVSRNYVLKLFEESHGATCKQPLREIVSGEPVTALPDEPLRVVVYRMAETGFTRLPVVDPSDDKRLLGMI